MTLSKHEFAPEEVMALLDGELPPAEAQAVVQHLEGCGECSALAEEMRVTTQTMAEWKVPEMPGKLDREIRETAARVGGRKRRRGWGWKPWVFAGGAVAALALAAVSLSVPQHSSVHRMAMSRAEPEGLNARGDRFSGGGLEQLGIAGGNPQESARSLSFVAPMTAKVPPPMVDEQDKQIASTVLTTGPMIARTASLTIEVRSVAAARAGLEAILTRRHGYAADLTVTTPFSGQSMVQGSVRVPAEELGAALEDLKTLGRVETEAQAGQEVGQQHADLEARLKTARDTEERFRSVLQQRTGTVADVMQVQEGIARVRGQIEAMEAGQRGLEHRVAYASVEILLSEEYKARLDANGDGVGTQLRNGLVAGYHNAAGTVLGMVLFVEEYGPALLIWAGIVGAPGVWFWRRYRRMRGRV